MIVLQDNLKIILRGLFITYKNSIRHILSLRYK